MPEPFRDEIIRIWQNAQHPLNELWDWARAPDEAERRADRWKALAEWAGSHKRNADHDEDAEKEWRRRQRIYRRREKLNRGQEPDAGDVPGMVDGGWHPDARRVGVVGPSRSFSGGPKKAIWHTTEGFGLPAYAGSNPHFTLDFRAGVLYQHQVVTGAARALQNLSGGVETNADGAIQVELIGFAAQSGSWSEQQYDVIAELARWIEKNCGVARECHVEFSGSSSSPNRLSMGVWDQLEGHAGHQHVPENNHWDPGAFRINEVLDK